MRIGKDTIKQTIKDIEITSTKKTLAGAKKYILPAAITGAVIVLVLLTYFFTHFIDEFWRY